ncbi:hypothetical protein [Saccharopolyspora sp. ASAGF58]|uniref:hypothetical protein n=1 Tax=Saccharopolyspora sp. ASAGF58 TaxID=2719023 RepID=UPI001B3138A9
MDVTARQVSHHGMRRDNAKMAYDYSGGRANPPCCAWPPAGWNPTPAACSAAGASALACSNRTSPSQTPQKLPALLLADPPQVLLLVEPTSHLSLTLVSALEDALHTACGAIVVASHDRWLRQRWNGPTLNLHDGCRSA